MVWEADFRTAYSWLVNWIWDPAELWTISFEEDRDFNFPTSVLGKEQSKRGFIWTTIRYSTQMIRYKTPQFSRFIRWCPTASRLQYSNGRIHISIRILVRKAERYISHFFLSFCPTLSLSPSFFPPLSVAEWHSALISLRGEKDLSLLDNVNELALISDGEDLVPHLRKEGNLHIWSWYTSEGWTDVINNSRVSFLYQTSFIKIQFMIIPQTSRSPPYFDWA